MRKTAVRVLVSIALASASSYADPPADIPRASDFPTQAQEATVPVNPANPDQAKVDAPEATTTANAPHLGASPRFYGFAFDLTAGDGSSLNAVGHNYRNEAVFYFEPKWNPGQIWFRDTPFKTLQVAGRFSLTQELSGTDPNSFGSIANSGPETPCSPVVPTTNGGQIDATQVGYCNPSANGRRLDYSDIWLTVRNPGIYTIPKATILVNPSVRFILPTSAESQYQSMVLAIAPGLNLSRNFWHDRIHSSVGLSFTKNFDQYSTPGLSPDQTGTASAQGDNPYDGLTGVGLSNFFADPSRVGSVGGYNVSYTWTGSVDIGYDFNDKFSFDVLYLYVYAQPYGHSCDVTVVGGQVVDTCATGDSVAASEGTSVDRPGHHDTEVFWATVSYKFRDWLSFNLAWINWAPALYPDSTFRQPFVSNNYDAFTTVQVSATLSFEKLAALRF